MDIFEEILKNKQYKEQIDHLMDETLILIAKDHSKALKAAQKGIQQVEPEKVNDVEYLETVASAMEKLAENVLVIRNK